VKGAWQRLGSVDVATLATIRPDGSPRLVPIVFAPVGEDMIVTAVDHKPKRTTALRRLSDIERDPRVSVLAHHYERDWKRLWWVRAEGLAGVEGDPPQDLVDALIGRYDQYRTTPPVGPWIIVKVTDIHEWSAGGDLSP
jgi:PPOX class probable F420-dependent enzyme